MGADGGIVGLEIRKSSTTLADIHAIVPHPFLYWDDHRDDDAMQAALAAAPGGYVWSTYGSFQEWSLMDLPGVVAEAKLYGAKYPDATMYDMLLDLVTRGDLWAVDWIPADQGYGIWDLSWFLLDHYLWVSRNSGYPVPNLGEYGDRLFNRINRLASDPDPFLRMNVGEWAAKVDAMVVLVDHPYSEETWT